METQQLSLITIVFMVIWGLLPIVLFYSFVKSYFVKKIKKAIIEEQFLYRVVTVKKKFSDLTTV